VCILQIGEVSVRFEAYDLVGLFLLMSVIMPAYFVAELYWAIVDNNSNDITDSQFIVIFALFVLVRFFTLYWNILCILNFDKGLKTNVFVDVWNHFFMPTALLNQMIGAVERIDQDTDGLIGVIARLGREHEKQEDSTAAEAVGDNPSPHSIHDDKEHNIRDTENGKLEKNEEHLEREKSKDSMFDDR